MPRTMFVNPFKRHTASEFPGVHVSFDQAAYHTPRSSQASTVSGGHAITSNDKPTGASGPSGGNAAISVVNHAFAIEKLKVEIVADVAASGTDTPYDRKAKVINRALQDMGMGRYQWELFALCGGGWMADNLWLQGVALTLPQLSAEFGVSETDVRYTTLALFLGLCIGASFWGTSADVVGRRLAFNCTLFFAGTFGLASGGAASWIGASALYACIGLGVGGNLPIDGALFLEFLPQASGSLLTLLSVFWPAGNLIASLLAWALIPNFSCPGDTPLGECTRANNWGWRYLILALGAITFTMFMCRLFLFHLYESPKFLLSRGRQAEAVATIYGIAHYNKTTTWLTEDVLNQVGGDPDVTGEEVKLGTVQIVKRSLGRFSLKRFRSLFQDKKIAMTTGLLWFQWSTIGMAYPLFNAFLPQYLANTGGGIENSTSIVYRNYAITAIVGVPGSVIAWYTVELKYLGRKGTMAIATAITGVFVFLFTISSDSNFQLAFTCLEAFFQNIMYGVLYAYTPEVFPAPIRGTGTGMSSFLNRVAGLCAPIVAINAGGANPKAPIYASGGLFIAAFVSMLLLPIETRGRQTL
ncbi:MFS general substrate transporter [Dothidotthia symphoricarpi CBS 119687]|uniref:MFS general substrate transporter n=1 Tax=Dothidotthia symphoricarpi CBS 119687 TaxID=1392245 RepID=A0A6A6A9D0_9PLEO|nr:MFS general substrate transporter [Dothidotthia symphoricarpi CBS 119687]KAF2127447.1 MFS general substrate transporter [Dothidotthia symphoricarpi CBS 119687]